MIRYTPASQLTIEGFEHPFDIELDKNNRWIKLASMIPWDSLASVYAKNLESDKGRLSVDIRMVIGAIIIKHKLKLSDRETVAMLSENLYLQYFCGLKSFQTEAPFDPSLFVDIRKRMGADKFDQFNDLVIARIENLKPKRKRILTPGEADKKDNDPPSSSGTNIEDEQQVKQDNNFIHNKGTLKIDATVADQQILYPTDLGLLNKSREESERIIDILCQRAELKKKPRTYRRTARAKYLGVAKQKKKSKKVIRKAIGQQLRFLNRNLKTIEKLLDLFNGKVFPLKLRDQRIFWVIQHIYAQQQFMYKNHIHQHENRIVNIYQPYVRPIVRGKEKAQVEFGAKINISEYNGMSKIDTISWEAYNEGTDMQKQVERYQKAFGCYPELVLADTIYLNRENRTYLKSKGIRIAGKTLGRPKKETLTPYQKRKQRKERNQRNLVEGKIGQGKNGYALNNIKARRKDTSESWISSIFFVMNLITLMKEADKLFLCLIKSLITIKTYLYNLKVRDLENYIQPNSFLKEYKENFVRKISLTY
jgi:transposase, IS5 family